MGFVAVALAALGNRIQTPVLSAHSSSQASLVRAILDDANARSVAYGP